MDPVFRDTCFFCEACYGSCRCSFDETDGFEHDGMWITMPNVSECGRFFVDPYVCYGDAFRRWLERGARPKGGRE